MDLRSVRLDAGVEKRSEWMDVRGVRRSATPALLIKTNEATRREEISYVRIIDEDEWTYAACGDRLSPHWAKRNESERMDLRGKRSATPCMVLARMKGVRGRGRGLRRK